MSAIGNVSLGCNNDYKVLITDSCGAVLRRISNLDVSTLRYNAILDDVGSAVMTVFHNDCSRYLSVITPGRSCLQINRNDIPVFRGPIVRVELAEESVRIIAFDPLWWVSRRTYIPPAQTKFADPVKMFETLVLSTTNYPDLDSADCTPGFLPLCFEEVYRLPGGILATAPADASDLRTVMDNMADSTIDYTVVGTTMLYGFQQVPIPDNRSQRRPVLTEASWIGGPSVAFDITNMVNDVRIRSAMPEPYRKTKCGSSDYGHHQRLVDQNELTTRAQTDAVADTYLALGDSTVFIENIQSTQLSPDVQWDIPRMVPGMQVDIGITVQGITVTGTVRLHEVGVSVEAGNEVVTVGLAPIGAA